MGKYFSQGTEYRQAELSVTNKENNWAFRELTENQ